MRGICYTAVDDNTVSTWSYQREMRLPSGEGVSLGDDENVLEPGSGDGYTPQWKYYMPLNWKLQSGYIYVSYLNNFFKEAQEARRKTGR